MRKILFLIILLMLFSTSAFAELWVCYDEKTFDTVTYNHPRRVTGDCLKLGICSGANNTGVLASCFEATDAEYVKAGEANTEVIPGALQGFRVVDMNQADINVILAEKTQQALLSSRASAKAVFNSKEWKAFVEILIGEINTLRTQHSLADRTVKQLRTAIDNKIDSGDVD